MVSRIVGLALIGLGLFQPVGAEEEDRTFTAKIERDLDREFDREDRLWPENRHRCRYLVPAYGAVVIDDLPSVDPPPVSEAGLSVDFVQPAQRLFYKSVPCQTGASICGVIGIANPDSNAAWFANRPGRGSGQTGLDAFLEL